MKKNYDLKALSDARAHVVARVNAGRLEQNTLDAAPILIESWFVQRYRYSGNTIRGVAVHHPERPNKPRWEMETSEILGAWRADALGHGDELIGGLDDLREGDVVRTRNHTYKLGEPLFREI